VLNDHRTKGNFILSEKTLKYLGELFKYINNLILNENDMELFKFIFILSMTYYHVSEKDQTKIYLFSYIKDHPDYQKIKFWEDYLNELVDHDLKGSLYNTDSDIKNKKWENLNKEEKEKLNNCYFSNFLTAVKAMADFRLDKKFVRDFVEKNKEKYILTQEQIENVCMIFDVSLNENETNYNGDYLDKERKQNINQENQEISKKGDKEKFENLNEIQEILEEINISENKNEIIKENKTNENISEKNIISNTINENNSEININKLNTDINTETNFKDSNENKDENNSNKNINEKKINLEDNIECENENNQTNNETI
jgi:hypothetical protein